MKIRQAPVSDLLDHMEGIYNNKPNSPEYKNVLEPIIEYYASITNHKNIMPIGKGVLEDWCDLNFSHTMDNCPCVPGILIYRDNENGDRKYGLLYHSGYINQKQTGFLSYYDISSYSKHLASHTFQIKEWTGWGAPTRYFKFDEKEYADSSSWELGERVLELNCFGHDVRQLQYYLHQAHPSLEVNGYYDEATIQAVKETQTWANVAATGKFDFANGGKEVIDFLTAGRKITR